MTPTLRKWLVVVVVVAAVTVAVALGALDALRDRDRVEEFLTDSGPWGPIVFILAFVALQPLSLPGALLIIPATFVWPWWQVTAYSVAGGVVASTVGFAMARWLARDWVQQRLPDRFQPWQQRLVDHEFAAIASLRVMTGYAPPADWFLGLSGVGMRSFLLGTTAGLLPGTAAMAVWGDDAVRWVGRAPLAAATVAAVVGAAGYGLYVLRNRALRRR